MYQGSEARRTRSRCSRAAAEGGEELVDEEVEEEEGEEKTVEVEEEAVALGDEPLRRVAVVEVAPAPASVPLASTAAHDEVAGDAGVPLVGLANAADATVGLPASKEEAPPGRSVDSAPALMRTSDMSVPASVAAAYASFGFCASANT